MPHCHQIPRRSMLPWSRHRICKNLIFFPDFQHGFYALTLLHYFTRFPWSSVNIHGQRHCLQLLTWTDTDTCSSFVVKFYTVEKCILHQNNSGQEVTLIFSRTSLQTILNIIFKLKVHFNTYWKCKYILSNIYESSICQNARENILH